MTNECKFCAKQINQRGSLIAHERQCLNNPDRIPVVRSPNAGSKKGSVPWNKGLAGDSRCKLSVESMQKMQTSLKNNGNCTGKGSTLEIEQERIRKIKEKAILNNGGYRKGSRQRKKGLV